MDVRRLVFSENTCSNLSPETIIVRWSAPFFKPTRQPPPFHIKPPTAPIGWAPNGVHMNRPTGLSKAVFKCPDSQDQHHSTPLQFTSSGVDTAFPDLFLSKGDATENKIAANVFNSARRPEPPSNDAPEIVFVQFCFFP